MTKYLIAWQRHYTTEKPQKEYLSGENLRALGPGGLPNTKNSRSQSKNWFLLFSCCRLPARSVMPRPDLFLQLFLKHRAAGPAGDLDRSVDSGHPKLLPAVGAFKILVGLVGANHPPPPQPASHGGGEGQIFVVFPPPGGDVAGEHTEDTPEGGQEAEQAQDTPPGQQPDEIQRQIGPDQRLA